MNMRNRISPIYKCLFVFWAIYIAILLSCLFYPNNHVELLNGLKYTGGEINLFDLSRWLVLLVTPLIGNAIILDSLDRMEIFILVRVKKRYRFELYEMLFCFINVLCWVIMISIFYLIFIRKAFIIWFLIFISHQLMLTTITTVIYQISKKQVWTLLTPIVFLALVFMIGERIKLFAQYTPLCWGMYIRGNGGLKIILNILVMALTIALRRITYDKNSN